VAGTAWLYTLVPKDFLPSEDTGRISVQTLGSPDASFAAMVRNQQQLAAIAMADPNVAGVMSTVGTGGASSGESTGTMLLTLKPRSQRTQSADQLIQTLMPKMAEVPGIRAFLRNPPAINIGGRSTTGQYQYTLQGLDLAQLFDWGDRMRTAITKIPTVQGVASDADRVAGSLVLEIDRSRAAALGISADEIQTVLGSAFGAQQISTIYTQLSQYQVILEVIPRYQGDPEALSRIYLRSSGKQLVPLDTLVTVSRSSAPITINHSGQLPSVTISFNLPPGETIGTAINDIRAVEQQMRLPDGITSNFEGTAQAFQSSMQGIGLLFVMAVLVVYIILGILYESFIHPLTILSGLPSAGIGALLTLLLFHVPLSLYAFVGIIMLVGIVKKNAIMMIDFALVRQRRDNLGPEQAIHEAALVRFRPIMMTTMAALVGTLPIAIGFGSGGETRAPLGLAVVGGLLFSQVLTLYLTPVIYIYLDRLSGSGRKTVAPAPVPAE
jgi:HAE1 family hydrophobic/amphiphilic exporter-1